MRPGRGRLFWASFVGALTLLAACSKQPSWTDAEKENADLIPSAFAEAQQAVHIANAGPGQMSMADFEQMRAHQKRAIELAASVRDEILDKVNPTMRQHWRGEFTEGLRLQMQNYPGHPDTTAEINGQALTDRFGDWWNENKESILIPE
jgi:hypothetical protein